MLRYLASPYTHPNRNVEDRRAKAITYIAGQLVKAGEFIFCPIAHAHAMNRLCGIGGAFEYWRKYDEMMISVCNELLVCTMQDWTKSTGVTGEIAFTREQGKMIRYLHPIHLDITREPDVEVPLASILDYWKTRAHST